MSREIKFRIWDKQFKKFCSPEKVVMNVSTGQVKGYRGGLGYCDNWHVEQYTGLKDKNGVEIYEGDIVEINGYNSREGAWIKYFEVVWDDVGFCLKRRGKLYGFGVKYDNGNHRKELVIGNIHENPELLEKQNG